MKVLSTTTFQGPNIFAPHPVIHYAVDLSALGDRSPRRLGPTFVDGLVGHLPGLAGHPGGDGKAGGFVAGLGERKGATLADVMAHAAIELQRSVVESIDAFYGAGHFASLRHCVELANMHAQAGDFASAVLVAEDVLAKSEALLGPDHPRTVDVRQRLAIYRR